MRLISIFCASLLFATTNILNENYNDKFNSLEKKLQSDTKKLKLDWINPITYTYTYSDTKTGVDKTSVLSVSQPIFRSGGIYQAIKYAKNYNLYNKISIDISKKELIKQALNLVYNIKKLDLQIKKQNNLIKNALIDIKVKKESVFNGILDISFLNNAIIAKNQLMLALIDLKSNKQELIENLKNISSLDYNSIKLPEFKIFSFDKFEKDNIYIKQKQLDIKVKHNLKYMTYSKYLPTINLNYQKQINHTQDRSDELIGFSIVIPFDIKAMYEPNSSKINELIAKKEYQIQKEKEKSFFKTIMFKVNMIDKKISLTKDNIKVYKDLILQMEEMVENGIKTNEDLEVLKNSLENEKINLQIYKIDKNINLLELYYRFNIH